MAPALPLVLSLLAAAPLALPAPARVPEIDGRLRDLAPAAAVPLPAGAKALGLQAAFGRETLYLGVTLPAGALAGGAQLDVALAFPGAGPTSGGVVLRLTRAGLAPPPELGGAEPWAQARVKAAVAPGGGAVELAVPARALPRFPAAGPLLLEVCLELAGGPDREPLRTCPGTPAVLLPDGWRTALALPRAVQGAEGRPEGWVGTSRLQEPVWVRGDAALSPASLSALVAGDQALSAEAAGVAVPARLALPDGRPLLAVLTGRVPGPGCTGGEPGVRLWLFLVQGPVAVRVLEAPAATCQLGRVTHLALEGDGGLAVGYSSGAELRFGWNGQAFERTELGWR